MPRLEAGKHEVTVRDAYMSESSKGTMGITFLFENDEGDIDCTRWVTPATSERVLTDLETLGFSRDRFNDIANLEKLADITRGARCSITVEDEEYAGNITPKVKWINPVGPPKANTKEAMQRVFSILTGNTITGGLVSAPRRPQNTPPPSAPISDDDVPF